MVVLKYNGLLSDNNKRKIEEYIKDNNIDPKDFLLVDNKWEVIDSNKPKVRIITKHEYMLNMLVLGLSDKQTLEDTWSNISKGHNFVICFNSKLDKLYSVDCIDKLLIDNK